MREDYTELFTDPQVAAGYRRRITRPTGHAMAVTTRQRRFLRHLVTERFDTPPVQHDFACGTGRALSMLEGLVSAAHGYDTAPAMLAEAGAAGVPAELHLLHPADPTPAPVPTDGPAIVTMLRLMLNAPPALRDAALGFAAQALPDQDSGLLVLENHGHRRSLRHLHAWRRRHHPWFAELGTTEVRALLARHGFRLLRRRGFALSTQGFYRSAALRGPARLIDEHAAGPLTPVATNLLYVAVRESR